MALALVSCTVKQATRWVAEHHRHLKRELAGGRFAVAVADESGAWRGVAVATSGPRVWEGTGRLNIARVGTDGVRNGCSMLYGAMCRAGKALGYKEAWTYTLPSEPGTSLRAAGFEDMGENKGGGARPESSPEETSRAAATEASVEAKVGHVTTRRRNESESRG